jgi:hypothetical protein
MHVYMYVYVKDCYAYAVLLFIRIDRVRLTDADLRDVRLDYLVAGPPL